MPALDLLPSLARSSALLFSACVLLGCGRDDEAQSARSRPTKFVVDYGMRIYFGFGGDGARIQISGWSGQERFFTWSEGHKASLGLRLPSDQHDVRLRFRMQALVKPPELPFQPVNVIVNSVKLASWEVAEEQTFNVVVPARLLHPPASLQAKPGFQLDPGFLALVDFEIPKAISPHQLGVGDDRRVLGIRMYELQISKVKNKQQPPQTGSTPPQ
jgi:hypothetical protein